MGQFALSSSPHVDIFMHEKRMMENFECVDTTGKSLRSWTRYAGEVSRIGCQAEFFSRAEGRITPDLYQVGGEIILYS